ncbi:unnamed protein product, partial [Coregonus sp. 'balchen']
MAGPNIAKPKFNEYLQQRMTERVGGKEKYKKVKKVWEEVKLRWTQAGYLRGGPPSEEELKIMEKSLEVAVEKAKGEEEGKNKAHRFKKEGTKKRKRAQGELRVGTWAIEESRRVHPKKSDTMCVKGSPTVAPDTSTRPVPTSLYPLLTEEALRPPPYTPGQEHNIQTHHQTNPFLSMPQPAIQAPVLTVGEGSLKGTMTFGINGGQLLCEQPPSTSTPYQPKERETLRREEGGDPTSPGGRSLLSFNNPVSGVNSENEGAEYLVEGIMRGTVTNVTDTLRDITTHEQHRRSARVAERNRTGGPQRTDWETERTNLWDALRRAYPTERNQALLSSFTINPGEHPAEYLDRAKTTWRTVNEEPFDHTDTTLNMWKEMVINGCPGDVKTKLRATVGLTTFPLMQFNAHVHHHVTQHNKDKGGAESQVQSLQVQLLKLQLKEAQKGEKPKKQMLAEETPGENGTPDLFQVVTTLAQTVSQMIQLQASPPQGTPAPYQPQPPFPPQHYVPQPQPWPQHGTPLEEGTTCATIVEELDISGVIVRIHHNLPINPNGGEEEEEGEDHHTHHTHHLLTIKARVPRYGGGTHVLAMKVPTTYDRKRGRQRTGRTLEAQKAQEGELSGSTLTLKVNVGDWVRVKVHKRKWLEPRWTGPYEVKEVTSHSVQVR